MNIPKEKQEEFIQIMNKIVKNDNLTLITMFATDVIHNGSYLYYNETAKELLSKAFQITDIKQGEYLDGCVSRKKQIVPNITNVLQS